MTSIEQTLAAMEQRLAALEQENQRLRAAAEPRAAEPVPKCPDKIRAKIEELTPYHRMQIADLARDTVKYGYEQAMIMHGRKLPRRGRKAKTLH